MIGAEEIARVGSRFILQSVRKNLGSPIILVKAFIKLKRKDIIFYGI
ncbi:Uncharacterized protein dnm_074970 [Desulfonema magnum]|uniref:Uncharacterized protein n=1 Tax=Desulfonema magnum TaxID=45655 RepID=A0A975BTK2_9BACT|nr:Uncharacterized protein dnm_074970 [Desulfonema magnum]